MVLRGARNSPHPNISWQLYSAAETQSGSDRLSRNSRPISATVQSLLASATARCCRQLFDKFVLGFPFAGMWYYVKCRRTTALGLFWTTQHASLRLGRSGDRIPMGARFSVPIQIGPRPHPASCTVWHRVSARRVKRPGRGVDHPTQLAPTFTPPLGLHGLF